MEIHILQILKGKRVNHLSQLANLRKKDRIILNFNTPLQMCRSLQDQEQIKVVKLKYLALERKHWVDNFCEKWFVQESLVSGISP